MEEKKKHKVMIGIEVVLLCMIIAIIGTKAASSNPPSNGVSYSKNSQTTVEGALNDLYNKASYGNASASQILKGKTALVKGKKVTGTYEAPSLASLTPGDAVASDIEEDKIAWVNGKKIVGTRRMPLTNKLRIGDFVSYTPNSTSYKVTVANSEGVSNKEMIIFDRTINPSELNLWRVIRKNDDGTVDVVSEYVSKEEVGIIGDKGCEYYIIILKRIAEAYENSAYTVGSRHVGYDGTASEHCIIGNCSGASDEGYETDVKLLETAIGTLKARVAMSSEEGGYYLASRSEGLRNMHYNTGGIRLVANGKIASINLSSTGCGTNGNCVSAYSTSVRPIVVLKSTLKITGGNGTESSPYTLGV